jgi:hypothetical protein
MPNLKGVLLRSAPVAELWSLIWAPTHMQRITLPILLTMFAGLIGCTKSKTPRELSTVQGDWLFDEAGYVGFLRSRYKDPEELKKMVGLYEFAKKNGTPVMTDIAISGLAHHDWPRFVTPAV